MLTFFSLVRDPDIGINRRLRHAREFGAPHGMELPFLFGSDADWVDAPMLGEYAGCANERLPIGRELRAAWARFAHDGTLPDQTSYLRRLS
jgi:para-nitrobenzyl esterase